MAPAAVMERLRRAGQAHVLRFYDELPAEKRTRLLRQIEELDLDGMPALVERYVRTRTSFRLPPDVEPAPYYPHDAESPARRWDKDGFREAGRGLLSEGKVAAFVVAGGQGSRLGFDGPKGCFPAGPVTAKSLFQIFAEGLVAAGRKYGRPAPWYIMTSPQNHGQTVEFFQQHRHFGLNPSDVMMFPQGVLPSFDLQTGRLLLAEKDEIATNPDGHGGSIKALWVSGAVEDMQRRGVEHISYFQVDNPLVRVVDPVFLGLHATAADSSGEMSSKMIPKAYPEERVGLFCRAGGRVQVIEYSDLPMDLQRQKLEDGTLRFIAGSIAVHAMSVEFVQRLSTDPSFDLPYHRAEKKVACIDPESGSRIEPEKPNAVKLERFVFDAVPLGRASIVYETERTEEFAPIKNATGVDSVETSRELQTERAARWLGTRAVLIPRKANGGADCVLEISPLTASEPEDLAKATLPREIDRGARVAF